MNRGTLRTREGISIIDRSKVSLMYVYSLRKCICTILWERIRRKIKTLKRVKGGEKGNKISLILCRTFVLFIFSFLWEALELSGNEKKNGHFKLKKTNGYIILYIYVYTCISERDWEILRERERSKKEPEEYVRQEKARREGERGRGRREKKGWNCPWKLLTAGSQWKG